MAEPFNPRQHWQQVYTERAPSAVSWFQAEPALSLELIRNCRLAPAAPLIDVGGGASVLVDRLLREGHTAITVLDVAGAALAVSRHRLGPAAAQVEWIEADVTAFQPPRSYALWHDRAVFHFLTAAADRMNYVRALKRALSPGGFVILATFAVGGPDRCSGLPVAQYDAAKLLAALGAGFRLLEERSEHHLTPARKTQAFAWFRLVRTE